MWKAKVFESNASESALSRLLQFLNQEGLTTEDFSVIACPESMAQGIILLYQEPEKVPSAKYQSLCQEDVLSDQWP